MVRLLLLLVVSSCAGRSPDGPPTSELVSSPSFLMFSAQVGEVVAPQLLSLSHAHTDDLCWRISVPVAWVAVSRTSGCGPSAVAVSVETRGLAPGTHVTLLAVEPTDGSDGSPATVTVQLELSAPGWTALDGPSSGPMTAVAVDPSDPSRVVAGGTRQRSFYFSNDGGASFARGALGLGEDVAVSAIELTENGRGYLTVAITNTGGVGGAWWSSDAGATWQASTAGSIDLLALAVHPNDPLVALATGAGVWLTEDGGVSWTPVGSSDCRAITTDASGFWVGANDGSLYRSDSGAALGLNHIFRTDPDNPTSNTVPVLALAHLEGGPLIALTGGNTARLWRSVDGTTWELASATGADLSGSGLVTHGSELWLVNRELRRSTNAGETFTVVPVPGYSGLDGKRFVDLAAMPDGGGFVAAHESAGIVRYDGSGFYQALLTADTVHDLELDPATASLHMVSVYTGAFAHDAAGFRTLGGPGLIAGTSWNISLDPRNAAHILVGAVNCGGLYRSTNFGQSWTLGAPGIPSSTCVRAVERAPEDPDVVWIASCSGLYRSIDAGQTFTRLETSGTGTLAAVSTTVAVYSRSAVRRYDVAGSSEEICATDPSFLARTADGSVWWAASGHGLHRSTDGGLTFEHVAAGTGEVRALKMDPTDPSHLYLANPTTVLESSDSGTTWTDLGAPFPPQSLLLDPGSTTLWVGTDGGGVYRFVAP